MSTATGQEKPDEDPISVLTLSGRDFQEIEQSTTGLRKNFWIWVILKC